jgi:hypothetical protein
MILYPLRGKGVNAFAGAKVIDIIAEMSPLKPRIE